MGGVAGVDAYELACWAGLVGQLYVLWGWAPKVRVLPGPPRNASRRSQHLTVRDLLDLEPFDEIYPQRVGPVLSTPTGHDLNHNNRPHVPPSRPKPRPNHPCDSLMTRGFGYLIASLIAPRVRRVHIASTAESGQTSSGRLEPLRLGP